MSYPIEISRVKERISESCFFALGSLARYELVKIPKDHDYGVDFELKKILKRGKNISPISTTLTFQLKSTVNWSDDGNNIKYLLKSKSYNDIITSNIEGGTPIILILMCLPKDNCEWICVEENSMIFQKGMYWYYTDSKTLVKSKSSHKTVLIPKCNIMTEESFKYLVDNYGTKIKR